jgi:hypothetical protein
MLASLGKPYLSSSWARYPFAAYSTQWIEQSEGGKPVIIIQKEPYYRKLRGCCDSIFLFKPKA